MLHCPNDLFSFQWASTRSYYRCFIDQNSLSSNCQTGESYSMNTAQVLTDFTEMLHHFFAIFDISLLLAFINWWHL